MPASPYLDTAVVPEVPLDAISGIQKAAIVCLHNPTLLPCQLTRRRRPPASEVSYRGLIQPVKIGRP